MTDPVETAELLAFVRTVEARSLSRAAVELALPRVTIGRRLARLEERLGVRLLRRTTRRLALTDAGEELYSRARVVLAAVSEAEAAVRRADGAVRGLLRVAIPPGTAEAGMHELVLAFASAYPEVELEVTAGTPHVDLVSGGCDVAIRAATTLDPGLVGRTLARVRHVAVASPAYLAKHGAPTLATLEGHLCVVGYARGERPTTHWPLADGGQVRIRGVLATNDVQLQHAAARAGHGIALVPEVLARAELRSGALVAVLPEVGTVVRVAVVYAERELAPPAVRAFVQFVSDWWREHPPVALVGE